MTHESSSRCVKRDECGRQHRGLRPEQVLRKLAEVLVFQASEGNKSRGGRGTRRAGHTEGGARGGRGTRRAGHAERGRGHAERLAAHAERGGEAGRVGRAGQGDGAGSPRGGGHLANHMHAHIPQLRALTESTSQRQARRTGHAERRTGTRGARGGARRWRALGGGRAKWGGALRGCGGVRRRGGPRRRGPG
jgi:hypothetical protein